MDVSISPQGADPKHKRGERTARIWLVPTPDVDAPAEQLWRPIVRGFREALRDCPLTHPERPLLLRCYRNACEIAGLPALDAQAHDQGRRELVP